MTKKILIYLVVLISVHAQAQQKIVVVDAETLEVLPYVEVYNSTNKYFALTDQDGKVELKDKGLFEFLILGYASQQIENPKDTVKLSKTTFMIDEVVVTDGNEREIIQVGFHDSKKPIFYHEFVKDKMYYGTLIENSLDLDCIIKKLIVKFKSSHKTELPVLRFYLFEMLNDETLHLLETGENLLSIEKSRKSQTLVVKDANLQFSNQGVVVMFQVLENSENLKLKYAKTDSTNLNLIVGPQHTNFTIISKSNTNWAYPLGLELNCN